METGPERRKNAVNVQWIEMEEDGSEKEVSQPER